VFAPIPVVPDAKECEVGGSPIDPHPLKRFCSDSCRQKARYQRVSQAARVRRRRPVGPPKVREDTGPRTSVPAKTP
jgi:predicted nucleic acid-binding Zn ribbon protein